MKKPGIILANDHHRDQAVISMKFDKDHVLISRVKSLPGARWSQSRKFWYIPVEDFSLSQVFEALQPLAFLDYSGLKDHKKQKKEKPAGLKPPLEIPQAYKNLLEQKRYAENTKSIYQNYFADFIRYFQEKKLHEISKDEINAYILHLIRTGNISPSQQNQRINAIKFYYEKVLNKKKEYYDIERPRKEKRLPDVLSKEEIAAMITVTKNIKHQCLIAVTYSCGLRRSEVINLKIADIDSSRMQVKIRGAKGKKDRYVPLARNTLAFLREYYKKEKPVLYLFEGNNGKQYSKTSIYNVIVNAAKHAGITKRV
jgi:integrase/recombinase XerD